MHVAQDVKGAAWRSLYVHIHLYVKWDMERLSISDNGLKKHQVDATGKGTEKLDGISKGQVIKVQENTIAKSTMIPRADVLYTKQISLATGLA